jgi:single-strand DNA-binding protein
MPSRCLNRVLLIGNLTRDPELRYTPAGMAVVSFGLATNRVWVTKQGEKKEDAQFHRIVAWNKLAELCSQLLSKGRRIYVEGRIQYREITDQQGIKKQVSEIVIDDMIILDNKGATGQLGGQAQASEMPVEHEVAPEDVSGNIEDIVIPDDLGGDDTTVTEDKTASVPTSDVTKDGMSF